MIWSLLLLLFIVWRLFVAVKGRNMRKLAGQIRGLDKPAWPIMGHSYVFFGDNENLMKAFELIARDALQKGGLSSFFTFLNKFILAVADPAIADHLLRTCLEKDEQLLKAAVLLTGNGSIFARANIWRPRRKILAPIFSMKNLNMFVDVFAKQSAVMVNQISSWAGAGEFSIWSHVNTYTFDAICETTLGIQTQSQQKTSTILCAVEEVFRLIGERACKSWMHSNFVYKMLPHYRTFDKNRQFIYNFADEVVKSKRLEISKCRDLTESSKSQSKNKIPSVLEMLIESGANDGFTDHELREEIVVMLLAGTDTSAVGTAFTIVMMSRHEDVQWKVYEELREVFGDSDRLITSEDLPKLKYLDAVIKETLRLYPPVPVTAREVQEDIKLPSGATLVKDVSILINIWGIHRNTSYWGEDAELFRPERFLEGPLKHPAQFMPFSYGVRNCLGYQYAMMSMKTAVAAFLRTYVVLPPDSLNPQQLKTPLRVKYVLDMKHVDNYVVKIEKRTSHPTNKMVVEHKT